MFVALRPVSYSFWMEFSALHSSLVCFDTPCAKWVCMAHFFQFYLQIVHATSQCKENCTYLSYWFSVLSHWFSVLSHWFSVPNTAPVSISNSSSWNEIGLTSLLPSLDHWLSASESRVLLMTLKVGQNKLIVGLFSGFAIKPFDKGCFGGYFLLVLFGRRKLFFIFLSSI